MKTGMLWQFMDVKTLEQHVADATRAYEEKNGVAPDLCHVHPDTLTAAGSPAQLGGLVIVSDRQVLRKHLWIGHEPGHSTPSPV
jgi:hypothetical protein